HPPAESWLRRLCRAILEDALACLAGKGPSSNLGKSDSARRAGQAWQWFASEATYFFSFTTVCAVLDLEAEAVRRQVRQRARQEPLDRHREVREKVKETVAAARETVARAHAAFDRTRERLHELNESHQLHHTIVEHKAGQQGYPHSDQSLPQVSTSLPEPVPTAELLTRDDAE